MKAIAMPRPTTVNYNSAAYEAIKYRNEISRAVQAADEDPRSYVSHAEIRRLYQIL
jgi:hypothetical protein